MRKLITVSALVASTLGFAGMASAQPQSRLSDLDYVKASRCAGLSEGADNAKALRAFVDQQSRGRAELAQDRADQARRDAALQIRAASGERLQRLSAERDACSAAFNAG